MAGTQTTNRPTMAEWMALVEKAIRATLPDAGPHEWLLLQSLFTHGERLATLPALGVGRRILDVGAGTGALSLDMAWLLQDVGSVTAVDRDAASLRLLAAMAGRLGVRVDRLLGDIHALPVESHSQDLSVARLVFQYLQRPEAALREMMRVTRGGGRVAVIAVDEDAGGAEPPLEPPLQRLYDAITELQRRQGGNRRIGRHLYRLMRECGLTDIRVSLLPRIRLGTSQGRNGEVEDYQRNYLQRFRGELVDGGLISDAEFTAGLAALERSFTQDRFQYHAEFLAIGQVPQ